MYSIADSSEGSDLQVEGLKESVGYILDVIKREVEVLDGDSGRLVLGGMSQGMATALWPMLCSPALLNGKIGAFMGFCGWLPFAGEIQKFLMKQQPQSEDNASSSVGHEERSTVTELLLDIIGYKETQVNNAALN